MLSSWYISYDEVISITGLSTNVYCFLSVSKVTCLTIPIGTLAKCENTGDYEGE